MSDATRVEPAGRPAGEAPDPLRRPRACQPAARLRVALRVRDDGAARGRGRLRLHRPGTGRLDGADRRAGGAADQERPLAGRLTAAGTSPRSRLLAGVWQARREAAAATPTCPSSRLRWRSSPTSASGRVARVRASADDRLRAPDDGAVPGVPDGGRLDHGRVPEAGACGSGSATRSAGRSCRTTSASPIRRARPEPRRARAHARRCSPSDRDDGEWLEQLAAHGVPSGPVNDVAVGARPVTQAESTAATWSTTSIRRSGWSAARRRRSGCRRGRRRRGEGRCSVSTRARSARGVRLQRGAAAWARGGRGVRGQPLCSQPCRSRRRSAPRQSARSFA